MEPENQDKDTKKKQQQHAAWRRWYDSDKGKAYRQKRKESNATEPAVEPEVK